MDLHLKGKTVVITGGGTGIGRETAEEFLKEGAKVAICGRRTSPLEIFKKEMEKEGFSSVYFESIDVTDQSKMKDFARHVSNEFGGIDIWVNNAGVAIDKQLMEFNEEDWNTVISIDLKAVYDCTRIAASYMKERGGVIINASSFASQIPHANGVIYAAAKAAVSNLTKSTAAALAPYDIRVVGYIPGMIITPISEKSIENYKDKFLDNIALGRLGRPADIAKPIVFLASDAADYITGVDIEITGGKFAVQDCRMAWRFKEGELT